MLLPPPITTTTFDSGEDGGRGCYNTATNLAILTSKGWTQQKSEDILLARWIRGLSTLFVMRRGGVLLIVHMMIVEWMVMVVGIYLQYWTTPLGGQTPRVLANGNCISTLSMVLNGTTMEEDIRLTQQGGGVG